MPKGTIGYRWATEDKGKWNLELTDGLTGDALDPELTFAESNDSIAQVEFDELRCGVDRSLDTQLLRTQVHRNVRCLHEHATCAIE